jgi:hypothetical protein
VGGTITGPVIGPGGATLHARLDLITTDPLALGGCLTSIEGEVRPAAESRPGSLRLSLLASPESDAAVLESFWASRDALAASEQAEALQDARRGQQARASPLPRPVRTAYEAPAADPNLIRIV